MGEQEKMEMPAALASAAGLWLNAWMQPWSALRVWNDYWLEQWKTWLGAQAAAPATWLPALAAERVGASESINFFLPWMPRIEALVVPLDEPAAEDAMRVMLRAALPRVGAAAAVEWLTVDATIRHASGDEPPALVPRAPAVTLESAAAPPKTAAKRGRVTVRRAEAVLAQEEGPAAAAVQEAGSVPAVGADTVADKVADKVADVASAVEPAAAEAAAKPARSASGRRSRKPAAGGSA